MPKCLLIGDSGIIGSYLKNCLFNFDIISINSKHADLTEPIQIKKLISRLPKIDIVIFLVGLAHGKGKKNDLDEFEKINYKTSVNFFSYLDENGKLPDKIIYASTISVYGEQKNINSYDESSSTRPLSPYARTKLMAEDYILENYKNFSWILRFAPVYSTDFMINIKRRTKISNCFYQVGNGNNKLSLCNIKNIKLAIEQITENNVPPGVYNITDKNPYTYNELLRWQNAQIVLHVPKFIIIIILYIGVKINNTFLQENSVKLLTDNIYPSDKIRRFIDLPENLQNLIHPDA